LVIVLASGKAQELALERDKAFSFRSKRPINEAMTV
jgi:hypothetical protein